MSHMKASIYFDSRRKISKGEHAGRCQVKILVEFDGQARMRRYYQTGVYATKEEFDKLLTGHYGRVNKADEEILNKKRKTLLALEAKAKEELKPGIHPDDFEPRFRSAGNNNNPLDMLLRYSEELKLDGQIGTSIFYRSAYSSFKKFCEGRLSFVQVTPRWLMLYEKWLLAQGRSLATVGTHVRPMRTVFKKAIDSGIIPANLYPFGRNKYKCPTNLGRKISLDEDGKNIVLNYKGEWQKDVDMWKFSYFCDGMNFADIARIRRHYIIDGVLQFDRTKTKNTERNKKAQVIILHEEAIRIINKWGNKDLSPDAYVFPVLRDGLTPSQEKDIIKDWIKHTNENLEKACKEMELPKITTYWARHTFATVLKRKGVSIEFIQEALGHADSRTTEIYLNSFDLETKRKISSLL